MSFKRDGNDTNLLDKLRKRRISELLSEDIPEDEAKLLCNGRFTCTVCLNNPIFDTVNMLAVHRQGKKHLSNLEIHKAKKRELNHLIATRKHQQYITDSTTTIKRAVSNSGGLLTSIPYDPRVKKMKVKKSDRKPILNLEEKALPSNNNAIAFAVKNTKDFTSGSSVWKETNEQYLTEPVKHSHQLKNIFISKVDIPVRVIPYQSKFRKHQPPQKNIESVSREATSQTGSQNHTLKHAGAFSKSYKDVHSISEAKMSSQNDLHPPVTLSLLGSTQKPSSLYHQPSSNLPLTVGSSIQQHRLRSGIAVPPSPASPEGCTSVSSATRMQTISHKSHGNTEQCRLKEQSQMSQKLRQLQGSGWKRDWDGKWIKDENAEFDSDEEPPDIP